MLSVIYKDCLFSYCAWHSQNILWTLRSRKVPSVKLTPESPASGLWPSDSLLQSVAAPGVDLYRAGGSVHRALCSLFQPDTDGSRISALSANTKTWPNVVSMLVQRRWRWANIETVLAQFLRLLGSTQVSVYTNPSPAIKFSPADQGTFSKTAGQSQAYYNTWNWERGTYDVNHLQILTCEGAVSRMGSVGGRDHRQD